MKKLIVNADGFGFTHGNNRAILELLPRGFIRSVSINVTWPAVEDVKVLIRDFPDVSAGLHWNLSVGPPICDPKQIPSLVGPDGEFLGRQFTAKCFRRQFDIEDMKRELRAQVNKLRDLGANISHWDSHQGRFLYPQFFEAAMAVAKEMGLMTVRTTRYYLARPPGPRLLRVAQYYLAHPKQIVSHLAGARKMKLMKAEGFRMPDYVLAMPSYGPGASYSREAWKDALTRLPDGLWVVVCHPGHPDETLRKYSSLVERRENEYQMFDSDELTSHARQVGVELVNYSVLNNPQESP